MTKYFICLVLICLLCSGCCKHDWKQTHTTYSSPIVGNLKTGGGFSINNDEYSIEEKILLGYTTILWECSKCHELRKEEMLGEEKKCQ